MKVKEAIRYLSERPEDEEIVIAWWRQDMFNDVCTKEEWEEAMNSIEKWMDWSSDYETIEYMIEESKRNNN